MGYIETEEKIEVTTQTAAKRDFSNPTRKERELLSTLSKEVFGSPNRYKKLYEYDELVTNKVEEVVPGENGAADTTKIVDVPKLYNGVKQYVRKYRTSDEILVLLKDFKVKRDTFMAEHKKSQEEAAAKKVVEDQAKKLQEELAGSALT